MIICAAGDIHGVMDRMYEDVLAFEAALGVRFAWVLHVGDFGVWPDPSRIDEATKKHDGAGDFPTWLAEGRAVPRKTVFIKGNHEDFVWLDEQRDRELLPGLFYLPNGTIIDITEGRETVRVGGVGGCYGPADFERRSKHLQGYAKRHYTRDEIETLGGRGSVDILLVDRNSSTFAFQRDGTAPRMLARTISLATRSSSMWQPAGRNGNPCSTCSATSLRWPPRRARKRRSNRNSARW